MAGEKVVANIGHMKIEVSRSFSRKLQVRQYEPIEFFCSAKVEAEVINNGDSYMEFWSGKLDTFVQSEVEKSAAKFRKVDTDKIKDVAKDEAENDAGTS